MQSDEKTHLVEIFTLPRCSWRSGFSLFDQISVSLNAECYDALNVFGRSAADLTNSSFSYSPLAPPKDGVSVGLAVQDVLFHLANAIFLIAYLAPTSR